MNSEEMKDKFKQMSEAALEKTFDEFGDIAIDTLKEKLLPMLESSKQNLIDRLKKEIDSTNSIGIKARDYFYIFVVKFVENIYAQIEKSIEA